MKILAVAELLLGDKLLGVGIFDPHILFERADEGVGVDAPDDRHGADGYRYPRCNTRNERAVGELAVVVEHYRQNPADTHDNAEGVEHPEPHRDAFMILLVKGGVVLLLAGGKGIGNAEGRVACVRFRKSDK